METLANRNNNPGNIRDTKTGKFKVFNSPQEGYAALLNDLETKKSGKSSTGLQPNQTLADFAKVYAPEKDRNNPAQYTANIANHMGVRPDTPLQDLDVGKWAEAISKAEGYKGKSSYEQAPDEQGYITKTSVAPTQSIEEQKQSLQSQGQPVSTQEGRAEPTMAGNVVRGIVKPFAKLATSGVNLVQDVIGQPETQPFSGDYLGTVSKIGEGFDPSQGFTKENTKALKESVGTGLEIGSNLVGGTGVKSVAKEGLKGLIKSGAIKGAKTGAITGGLQGVGSALEQNKSLKDTAVQGATGAITGGVLGGVLGGASGAIGKGAERLGVGKITENRINQANDKDLINLVNPKETLARYKSAVVKGTAGKTDENILKAAQSVKGVVDPSAPLEQNITRVRDAISTEAENLKNSILPVDHPIVFKELASNLKKVDLPITFKNDTIANKTLNQITDTAMKIAKKNGGKVSSLLDARKEFDRLVEESFPKLYENGKPTPNYFAITRTRKAINDFIEKELPEGFGFKESLAKQSGMYNAINGMKTKLTLPVGKFKGLMQKYPIATKVGLGLIEGTAAGGALKGLGVFDSKD